MRWVAPLVILVLLAGCAEKTSPVEVTPYFEVNDAAPGRPTDFAFHLVSTSPFKQEFSIRVEAPEGWNATPAVETLELRGKDSTSLVVRVTPHANASKDLHQLDVFVGDTRARVLVDVGELEGDPIVPGVGAQLVYVQWSANGTVNATNERGAPVKAYVGGSPGDAPPDPYGVAGYRPVIPEVYALLRDPGTGEGMRAGDTLAIPDLRLLVRVVSVDVLVASACDAPICAP